MQTKKLYYTDCNLDTFSATVLSCVQEGDLWQILLDQTAFYPTGGGQACDQGTLGDARVLEVLEQGETVMHFCDKPLSSGETVTGVLDWSRRLDQMQQHAGEHIVSGLINKHFGLHNVGFHVGAETVTIDFDGPLTTPQLDMIEQLANEAIWKNLPVHCSYPSQEELAALSYRSKKQLPWPVRIVEFPGYDICACCGVHVAHTGQIGLIKLLSCIKFHQGVRIEMVCGSRALALLNRIYEQNRLVSQTFSAKPLETGEAAQRISAQLSAEKLRSAELERQVLRTIATSYAGRGNTVRFQPDLSGAALRELADSIAQVCGGTAAVFSGNDAEGYSLCLADKGKDVKALGIALTAQLGGRGGGKPGFFQGSTPADSGRITAFFAAREDFPEIGSQG